MSGIPPWHAVAQYRRAAHDEVLILAAQTKRELPAGWDARQALMLDAI